ncbi:response regulator [Sphingomonas crocodyli]|uniref:Response regulator n=1 Tax=Sphingomonas crocodyli TaxID=1979270 RepID=A0A437M0L0_9SPHN|nr:response regulator [Sphingomonas crocodyli]RVT91188.1 response regulator [Sphingomonas crocodyli]
MRIVCLDDNSLIVDITTALLEELGHDVLPSLHPDHALDLLRTSPAPIDLLITDVHLGGGVDGREIARSAQRIIPGIRIICFTGDTELSQFDDGWVVLRKPCTLGLLEQAIDQTAPCRRPFPLRAR